MKRIPQYHQLMNPLLARTYPAERPIRQPAIGSPVVCHLIWTYILSE